MPSLINKNAKAYSQEDIMQNRSRTEYTVLNTLAGIGGYALNTVLGFVCRMVFVKCLSADYLGVNGLFTNLLGMLSLAELGIGSAVVYALYKPLAENDTEKIASLVKLYGTAYQVIGIVVAVIGLALMPFLNVIIQNQPTIQESIYQLYLINLFNTASTYFFSYKSSLIIAAQQNYIVSAVSYAVSIAQSALQIGTLLLTRNYLAYLLIQSAGTLVSNLSISHIAVKKFPYIRKKEIKSLPKEEKTQIFANVRDLTFYKISGLMVNSTDNILITFFDGLTVTGIASNYTLLVNTLNSLLSLLFNGLTASVGNHNATENKDKQLEMFRFLNMMNFWIFGWGALGIIFCSGDLVEWFFGKEYIMGVEVPLVLALNFYTVGMMNAVWTYKHTLGLFRYGRFLQIGTGILNIVFSILLGQQWGLFGILLATTIARGCTNLWYDPYVLMKHGFFLSPRTYLKRYCKNLLILLVAGGLCWTTFLFVDGPILVRSLVKIVLCSLITNIVFFLSFYRTREFEKLKQIVCNIWNILRRKRYI